MATVPVDTSIIYSANAETYFLACDYRIRIGARALLEMLRMEMPDYMYRRKPGRSPALDVSTAYAADNPRKPVYAVAARKPYAILATPVAIPVAEPVAGPSLFHSTFLVG